MSEKTYTWEHIAQAVGMWGHRLRMNPGLNPMSPEGLALLHSELYLKPHWIVASGICSHDPLGQRVDVYWSDCDAPLLSLICNDSREANLEEARCDLQGILEHWFPLGPSGRQRS